MGVSKTPNSGLCPVVIIIIIVFFFCWLFFFSFFGSLFVAFFPSRLKERQSIFHCYFSFTFFLTVCRLYRCRSAFIVASDWFVLPI